MGSAAAAIEVAVLELDDRRSRLAARGRRGADPRRLAGRLTALLAARAGRPPTRGPRCRRGLALLAPPSAALLAHPGGGDPGPRRGRGRRARDRRARPDPSGADRRRPGADPPAGARPIALVAAACATGTGLHDDLAGSASSAANGRLVARRRRARRSALLSDRHAAARRDRTRRLGRLGRAQDAAHVESRAGGVGPPRRRPPDARSTRGPLPFYDTERRAGPDRAAWSARSRARSEALPEPGLAGERGLGDYVARTYDRARGFWEDRPRPGFEVPYEPESNILCFRWGAGDQVAIRERLDSPRADFHLSSAVPVGRALPAHRGHGARHRRRDSARAARDAARHAAGHRGHRADLAS